MSESISGDAGRIGFLIKGDYSEDKTYNFLDVIFYKASSYVAKKETKGNAPAENNEYWQILASGLSGDFASRAIYGDTAVSLGRAENSAVGNRSIAYGVNLDVSGRKSMSIGEENVVSGINSFSGGFNNKVTGVNSMSTGEANEVIGNASLSAGFNNKVIGAMSLSVGDNNVSVDNYSFSEGCGNIALGFGSHAEGAQNISGAKYIFKIASYEAAGRKFVFDDTYEGFSDSFAVLEVGALLHIANVSYINDASVYTVESISEDEKSIVVKENIPASNFSVIYATLIKSGNINPDACHAEGRVNLAIANFSHAEGWCTIASGIYSHTEGNQTIASGEDSHAGGYLSEAKGFFSFAHGRGVIAGSARQTAIGWYNVDENTPANYHNPFVVGVGTDDDNRSNGFRISSSGAVYGKSEYNSSGADYAEFIKEWHDGNPDNEDRVGYFVTVKDGYLHKANEGDYIIGITSGNPSVVGNSDEEYYWRWERDEFNRIVYEEIPELTEKIDDDEMLVRDESGNPVMVETGHTITVMKQRNDYDVSKQQTYIERKNRKEWDYVGMVGVVPVRDDGTCEVGKFCKCAGDGIATLAEERGFDTYMVIDRISNSVVSVILK